MTHESLNFRAFFGGNLTSGYRVSAWVGHFLDTPKGRAFRWHTTITTRPCGRSAEKGVSLA